MFETIKMKYFRYLLKQKKIICHMCKTKSAVISDDWFMYGLPLCEECNKNLRIMDYNISKAMGDFDWIDDYNKLMESCNHR